MKLILNVVGLLIILILDACPNTAFPATPTPTPTPRVVKINGPYCAGWMVIPWNEKAPPVACVTPVPTIRPNPQPTLPIDFDEFCRDKGAGEFQGLASLPGGHGVAVLCSKADFLFTKSATPERVNRWPGASGTLPP